MQITIYKDLYDFLVEKDILTIFLDNYVKQYPMENKGILTSVSQFQWIMTPQGYTFWYNLYKDLLEYRKRPVVYEHIKLNHQ